MKKINVLDVTLRDGGCVNNFNFGQQYMDEIITAQEAAGVDIIEVGYLYEKNGSVSGRTQYINEQVIPKCIMSHKREHISYVAMMDYGKFDVRQLKPRDSKGIDGIRVAFHKKNYKDIVAVGENIMGKGYDLYIQPMITLRYSDLELLNLVEMVNSKLPNAKAFYIVDSFGEMRPNDMCRILSLVDNNLNIDISLGFHSHNNLQMSYSNAITLLQFQTMRDILIDCSIMGMGKGAGNLNTELLLEHLNLYYEKNYNIPPLLQVIDRVINQLHSEFYWGYAPQYYLSAIKQCTPSYASFFYSKHMLSIDQVGELLDLISPEKRNSFDKKYAELLYREYNGRQVVDDSSTIKELTKVLNGKRIILVAPGKSLLRIKSNLQLWGKCDDTVIIGLNVDFEFEDYIVVTRREVYDKVALYGKKVIVPSNIADNKNNTVLNYNNWIDKKAEVHDSSFVICMNLLKVCCVNKIMLAGFDGFSADINENYFDPEMRHPVASGEAKIRNEYYKNFILEMRKEGMNIEFITESLYE